MYSSLELQLNNCHFIPSIPKEKFGFSKNARVFLGPPKFEDASFFVGQNSIVEIMIELR